MYEEKYLNFINRVIPLESGKIGEFQAYCEKQDFPIIRKDTVRFLDNILNIYKPKKILEVGTAVGFSACFFASRAADIEVTTIERFPLMIEHAKKNIVDLGMENRVKLLEGDGALILSELNEEYDMVFLDSAKGQYINFFPDCMRLLKKGGLFIADDVLQGGTVALEEKEIPHRMKTIYRRLNQFIELSLNTEELNASLINVGDGMIFGIKQ